MKKILGAFDKGGNIWIAMHRLGLVTERHYQVRPIHIWTFLGGYSMQHQGKDVFSLLTALENKLYGVRLARSRLRESLVHAADRCYSHCNVQDYDGEQRAMFDLESYLNCIYSTLEIVSSVNRRADHRLPKGFRSQAKKNKYPLFAFDNWPWLPRFYDLRVMLTHYASPFPSLQEGAFLLEVDDPSGLEQFGKGRHRVLAEEILSYADGLVFLLDLWALHSLQGVSPDTEVFEVDVDDFVGPLKSKRTPARSFLEIADRFHKHALASAKDPKARELLSAISIQCQ